MKLWQKNEEPANTAVEKKIREFTVGSDVIWDHQLAEADIEGSIAHARMLKEIGLLTELEWTDAESGLLEILKTVQEGSFKIDENTEDIHSQIEQLLTGTKGAVGKKIHTGRSRNDQALTDIKLYIRKEIIEITGLVEVLFKTLITLSEKHKEDLMPGYTHLQLAMPSSFGLWFGAYAESLSDDLEVLIAAFRIANKNPLGSGAGFGSSLPLNRTRTTELLHFEAMHYNVVYAQMTRGKTEKLMAVAMAAIAATLSKMSMDVCLYCNQHFDLIGFPEKLTTGSSIMPHKKNPDVFELIRAKCNLLQGLPNQLTLLTGNLPSGYHRDLQLTKECLFPNIQVLKDCLDMAGFMFPYISIKKDILKDPAYRYLFTVEAVNNLVLKGTPFRDAYKIIGKEVAEQRFQTAGQLHHTHEGSIGNLCNKQIQEAFYEKLKIITG
jgi:argininosuccinate lyase